MPTEIMSLNAKLVNENLTIFLGIQKTLLPQIELYENIKPAIGAVKLCKLQGIAIQKLLTDMQADDRPAAVADENLWLYLALTCSIILCSICYKAVGIGVAAKRYIAIIMERI